MAGLKKKQVLTALTTLIQNKKALFYVAKQAKVNKLGRLFKKWK